MKHMVEIAYHSKGWISAVVLTPALVSAVMISNFCLFVFVWLSDSATSHHCRHS